MSLYPNLTSMFDPTCKVYAKFIAAEQSAPFYCDFCKTYLQLWHDIK